MSQRLIQSGVDNLDSGIGVYAGDEASYDVFAPLLDPILHEYHNVTAVCTMGQGCTGSNRGVRGVCNRHGGMGAGTGFESRSRASVAGGGGHTCGGVRGKPSPPGRPRSDHQRCR